MHALSTACRRTGFVPAELVHKLNPDGVLLTGWQRISDDTFSVTAKWPDEHTFYLVQHGHLDPVLVNETIRQTFPLLSHTVFNVPVSHHLLWERYGFEVTAESARAGDFSGDVQLLIECSEIRRRGKRVAALSLHITVIRQGLRLAVADTRFTIHSAAIHQRLRAGRDGAGAATPLPLTRPAQVSPQRLGRRAVEDLALTPTAAPNRWRLRVDLANPLFFDHPLDHVPGLLLLEAGRQAAQSAAHPQELAVASMEVGFHRYVELDAPCWIEARVASEDSPHQTVVSITMRQNGTECFSGIATLLTRPPQQPVAPQVTALPHTRRFVPGEWMT